MDTRLLEPDAMCVSLPAEPLLQPTLALLRHRFGRGQDMHLILDLARVEIITSPSIGGLLLLQRLLAQRGRRLVLCGARLATKCIFRVTGLDGLMVFTEDQSEALAVLHEQPSVVEGASAQVHRA